MKSSMFTMRKGKKMKSQSKFSIPERLLGWLIYCGDMCNMIALIFAMVLISLLTWTWPDMTHHQ